ncbi:hypothetical protein Avbf_16709, partial [Armadillidium vulgare]
MSSSHLIHKKFGNPKLLLEDTRYHVTVHEWLAINGTLLERIAGFAHIRIFLYDALIQITSS